MTAHIDGVCYYYGILFRFYAIHGRFINWLVKATNLEAQAKLKSSFTLSHTKKCNWITTIGIHSNWSHFRKQLHFQKPYLLFPHE